MARLLEDGDEIIVGRYRLSFLRVASGHTGLPAGRLRRRLVRRLSGWAHTQPRGSVVSAPMAQTIAVLSQKGGTGKTTTVRTLTDVLRRAGLRPLAIDMDPQGNLSDYFDLPPDAEPTIADVLSGRSGLDEAILAGHRPRQPLARGGRADARADGWAAS